MNVPAARKGRGHWNGAITHHCHSHIYFFMYNLNRNDSEKFIISMWWRVECVALFSAFKWQFTNFLSVRMLFFLLFALSRQFHSFVVFSFVFSVVVIIFRCSWPTLSGNSHLAVCARSFSLLIRHLQRPWFYCWFYCVGCFFLIILYFFFAFGFTVSPSLVLASSSISCAFICEPDSSFLCGCVFQLAAIGNGNGTNHRFRCR